MTKVERHQLGEGCAILLVLSFLCVSEDLEPHPQV